MSQKPLLDEPRLAYQIIVTAPGTKSQNWHGVLYDRKGEPVTIAAGATVKIGVGVFVGVPEDRPFHPFGAIHADTIAWMKTAQGNVIMDTEPWAYRLHVGAEGSKNEGWQGELLHGRGVVGPQPGKFETPMGPFIWLERTHPWGLGGWFHASWSAAQRQAPAKQSGAA